MKDKTTVIITILIVLIAGIGVYTEAFLNGGYNSLGSGGRTFREVVLNDPQGTGNINPGGTGIGNITGNITQTGTGNLPGPGTGHGGTNGGTGIGTGTGHGGTNGGTGIGTGTGHGGTNGGTGIGTRPEETRNDTNATRGRIITDMFGREVTVPEPAQINKVVGLSSVTTLLLYKLAPDKLGAWNSQPRGQFMKQMFRELPVIGDRTVNHEAIMVMRPCIIFESPRGEDINALKEKQTRSGQIPVVGIRGVTDATRHEELIRFVGEVLGVQQRADELIEFYNIRHRINRVVSNIPENKRVTVYYAIGPEGLETSPKGSQHSMLIEMSGGRNVVDVPVRRDERGWIHRVTVSLEQILLWNPEVILTDNPAFYRRAFRDPRWQNIRAVQNRRVYLIPQDPFNWFDMPPAVNRIIGIPWTATTLYPDKFRDIDMHSLTMEFYSRFYHYNLTDSEINSLLNP